MEQPRESASEKLERIENEKLQEQISKVIEQEKYDQKYEELAEKWEVDDY